MDGTMISGSQLFAAESSWFEKNSEFKNKKAGHFPNTETEVRPRTATTMNEQVRQDVMCTHNLTGYISPRAVANRNFTWSVSVSFAEI